MWQALDIFFFVFHFAIILVNLFGFLWEKTRRLQLIVLSLTTLSWVALGPFYGFGFCYCTEWHWQVRARLGDSDLPLSYIVWLFDYLLDVNISDQTGNILAVSGLVLGWIGGILVLYLKKKKSNI
jgi:hypothetical protein